MERALLHRPEAWTWLDALALGGTVCLSLVLGLIGTDRGLSLEEIDTLVGARRSFGALATHLTSTDHPLYALQAKLGVALLGEGPLAVRLPAVVFAAGSVLVLWWLAREVASKRVAHASALLMALSYPAVWYSHTARGVSGLLFWGLLCAFLLLRWLRGARSQVALGFLLSAEALVYGHWSALFFVCGLGLASLLVEPRRRTAISFGAATLVVLVLCAPALVSAFSATSLAAASPLERVVAASESPWSMLARIAGDVAKGDRLIWLAVPLALAVAGTGLVQLVRRGQWVVPVAVLIHLPLTAACLALASLPLRSWYFFPDLGFGCLFLIEGLVALGVVVHRLGTRLADLSLGAGRCGVGLVLLGIAASAATLPRSYETRQDFAGAHRFVESRRSADSAVVALGPAAFAFQAYYAPGWLAAENPAALRSIEARFDEVWVVHSFRPVMRSDHPGLLVRLEQEFDPKRKFAGAAAGDDVFVHRSRFGDVQIEPHDLGAGLHLLDTQRGGNVAVLVGREGEGLLIVDPSHWGLQRQVARALAAISDEPPVWVLNTHWHFDHAGGNEPLAQRGATVIATTKARERMQAALAQAQTPSDAALPTRLVDDELRLHFGGQEVHAFHLPDAHTDGDLIVHFPGANLFHMGDLFVAGAYPYISAGSGGSIDGYIAAQRLVLERCDAQTRLIPGHGPIGTRTELAETLDMLETARARVMRLKAAGRSLEETLAEDPLRDLQERWGKDWIQSTDMARFIYTTLPGV